MFLILNPKQIVGTRNVNSCLKKTIFFLTDFFSFTTVEVHTHAKWVNVKHQENMTVY